MPSTTSYRDNWVRLVAAVLKREMYLQLCRQPSRSPSISTEATSRSSSFSQIILNDSLECHSISQSHQLPQKDPSVPRVSHNGGGSGSDVGKSLILSGQDGRFKIDGWSNNGTVCPVQSNVEVKESASETIVSTNVPITHSNSNSAFAQDSCDALGIVYIWGDRGNLCDLFPTRLQCNVTLDVGHIACGVSHAALVTRKGEVFTWGREFGGELGHGIIEADVIQPRLLESLSSVSVGYVACGNFHTCAVTRDGELYTWGDGRFNAGLLGHGNHLSHWIPKRVLGPLEGLQVAKVACGTWHTALITLTGELYMFGEGTFGVLGHGNREDVSYPKKVESLLGLRTVAVACGVWHTAAVVEVVETQSAASCGKLVTWGDGDKYQLGHGDRDSRLNPTYVTSLVHQDFHKVSCGYQLTVGLTKTGRVFTMGSPRNGQLGNPMSDGKLPYLVKGELSDESVEEIACGSYHVTVLTSKNEVYTWGDGSNGRLGLGDTDDRKTPSLVEALKDKCVKYIACGSSYSVAICLQKLAFDDVQSHCSACHRAFGFTRKRHNCYNCGAPHCHACSSRKAALPPDPSKLCRVCDSCFAKLSKLAEAGFKTTREPLFRRSLLETISSVEPYYRWFDSAAEEQTLMPTKPSSSMSATPVPKPFQWFREDQPTSKSGNTQLTHGG